MVWEAIESGERIKCPWKWPMIVVDAIYNSSVNLSRWLCIMTWNYMRDLYENSCIVLFRGWGELLHKRALVVEEANTV